MTLGCLRAKGPLLEKLKGSAVAVREFHPSGGLDTPAGMYQMVRLAGLSAAGEIRRRAHARLVVEPDGGAGGADGRSASDYVQPARSRRTSIGTRASKRKWLRRIQNLSGVVLANATPIRDALIAEDGFAPEKLRVIHNGVDTAKFQRGQARSGAIVSRRGRMQKLVVLVGNMHTDVKGHPWLIAAAPTVLQEFPQIRFVFAGDGESQAGVSKHRWRNSGCRAISCFWGGAATFRKCWRVAILRCCLRAPRACRMRCSNIWRPGCRRLQAVWAAMRNWCRMGLLDCWCPPEDSDALAGALLRLLRDPELARQMAESGQKIAVENLQLRAADSGSGCAVHGTAGRGREKD